LCTDVHHDKIKTQTIAVHPIKQAVKLQMTRAIPPDQKPINAPSSEPSYQKSTLGALATEAAGKLNVLGFYPMLVW
jgi:hypothetical protein